MHKRTKQLEANPDFVKVEELLLTSLELEFIPQRVLRIQNMHYVTRLHVLIFTLNKDNQDIRSSLQEGSVAEKTMKMKSRLKIITE